VADGAVWCEPLSASTCQPVDTLAAVDRAVVDEVLVDGKTILKQYFIMHCSMLGQLSKFVLRARPLFYCYIVTSMKFSKRPALVFVLTKTKPDLRA
jgi:hypothetical protein